MEEGAVSALNGVGGRRSRLLERERELAQIDEAIAGACADRGGIVLVQGPAGIGKTRLMQAARRRAEGRGMHVLGARANELEQQFPFGVVAQLLCGELAVVSPEERSRLLAGAAAPAASVLGSAHPDAGATGDALPATLHGLYWLCVNLAAEGPLLVAVDDAHWADDPTLRWINFLASRLDGLPVLLLVGARASEPGADRELLSRLETDDRVLCVLPEPLSPEAVAELVRERVGEMPDPSFSAACHAATRGNPFLLGELLAAHAAAGGGIGAEAAGTVPALGPAGVSSAVVTRLVRLPGAAQALTAAVAVLGDGAALPLAAALADLDEDAASRAADLLASYDILEAGHPLAFVHPVVRAAIYEHLGPSERWDAHARAARLLSGRAPIDEVAAHLLACTPRGDPWASQLLARAAESAVARGALHAGVAYLRRALAEPPPVAERAAVLLSLASVEARVGAVEADERLAEAFEAVRSPHARADAALHVGRALVFSERFVGAVEAFERGASGAGIDPELRLRLAADTVAVANTSLSARHAAAETLARVRDARPSGATPAERLLLAAVAFERAVTLRSSAAEVAELAERALGDGDLLVEETSGSPGFYAGTIALILADRLEVAERHLAAALEQARARHSPRAFAVASTWRAWAAYRRGNVLDAEADAHAAVDAATEHGWEIMLPIPLALAIECELERGSVGDAQALLERHAVAARQEDSTHLGSYLASRGHVRGLSGDLDRAVADLRAAGCRHAAWGVDNPGLTPWRTSLAVLLARRGERGEAVELAEAELALARGYGAPRALGIALRATGAVRGGQRGLVLLEEAVAVLERSEAELELARARRRLGVALVAAGRPRAAREPLRQALDGAYRCGATATADASRRALVAAGGRPRRAALTGLDALTPSERRVARLAASGVTNREIAERRFLTLRTVEIHLTNVYRKLGIGSRDELPAAALGAGGAEDG